MSVATITATVTVEFDLSPGDVADVLGSVPTDKEIREYILSSAEDEVKRGGVVGIRVEYQDPDGRCFEEAVRAAARGWFGSEGEAE